MSEKDANKDAGVVKLGGAKEEVSEAKEKDILDYVFGKETKGEGYVYD